MAQINKPSDYFNTVLYTGNGSTQTITGVGFQPDWVWIKNRSGSQGHSLYDVVRGFTTGTIMNTASTSGEATTESNGLNGIDTDGFDLSGNNTVAGGTNANGATYVAWNWLGANGTASNTDGSITSTVSVNTTSGFSVGTYSANATAGATVGHGLGVTPDMLIVKVRNSTNNWAVYHKSIGETKAVYLGQTSGETTDGWLNNTAPDSSVFTLSGGNYGNASGYNLVFYAFAEKKGYSKFGSYTGNGSTDGSFIYTGFKPAFVILKRTDSSGFQWVLSDGVRDPDNAVEKYVHPSTNDPEQSGSRDIDFLSNGFKIRNSNTTWNASGGSYIYMCFAENPLVGTNNIPATAR